MGKIQYCKVLTKGLDDLMEKVDVAREALKEVEEASKDLGVWVDIVDEDELEK